MRLSWKMTPTVSLGVALLLLGVGFLVFVSSSCRIFDEPEIRQGIWTSGKQSPNAMAITDYSSISQKLAQCAGIRRSLLQKDTPSGYPPPSHSGGVGGKLRSLLARPSPSGYPPPGRNPSARPPPPTGS